MILILDDQYIIWRDFSDKRVKDHKFKIEWYKSGWEFLNGIRTHRFNCYYKTITKEIELHDLVKKTYKTYKNMEECEIAATSIVRSERALEYLKTINKIPITFPKDETKKEKKYKKINDN